MATLKKRIGSYNRDIWRGCRLMGQCWTTLHLNPPNSSDLLPTSHGPVTRNNEITKALYGLLELQSHNYTPTETPVSFFNTRTQEGNWGLSNRTQQEWQQWSCRSRKPSQTHFLHINDCISSNEDKFANLLTSLENVMKLACGDEAKYTLLGYSTLQRREKIVATKERLYTSPVRTLVWINSFPSNMQSDPH